MPVLRPVLTVFNFRAWLYGQWALLYSIKSWLTFEKTYYYHFVGHCGAFCGLIWRIWWAKMYVSPLNKPMKSENQTVTRYKQPFKIEKLDCSCHYLAAFVKGMMGPFSCPNHGWKHRKQQRKSKFSVFSTRGRRSTKVRGGIRAIKHQKTACSSSMAGGEVHVHVSFVASSQTLHY